MRERRLAALVAVAGLTTACSMSGLLSNLGGGHEASRDGTMGITRPGSDQKADGAKATLSLRMAPVQKLAAAQGYRTQSAEALADASLSSFKTAISAIRLIQGPVGPGPVDHAATVETTVYQSAQPVEFIQPASALADILNASSISVPVGTYSAIAVQVDRHFTFQAQAQIGTSTYYTRTATASDTATGPAEPLDYSLTGVPPKVLLFPTPLVLTAGSDTQISLYYDLSGMAYFGTQAHGFTQYANGSYFATKYFPMFAFIGHDAGTPEFYDVTIEDPGRIVQQSDKWHYRVVLIADPSTGEIQGLQSIGRIDDGYEYPSFNALTFVDTWRKPVKNADGSYQLFGLNDMDPDKIPEYEVPAFKRSTHDGTLAFYKYKPLGINDATPMPTPITLNYKAVRL